MKFAPNLSYMVNPNSHRRCITYKIMGLWISGMVRLQVSVLERRWEAIYKIGPCSLGAVLRNSPKNYAWNVANFDQAFGSTTMDDLDLESPQTLGFGVAYEPIPNILLLEADVKWLNWADAGAGYKDFGLGWPMVFQYRCTVQANSKLALRARILIMGKILLIHIPRSDFDGPVNVQGKSVPRTNYEILRIAGFPAIVESHLTAANRISRSQIRVDRFCIYARVWEDH